MASKNYKIFIGETRQSPYGGEGYTAIYMGGEPFNIRNTLEKLSDYIEIYDYGRDSSYADTLYIIFNRLQDLSVDVTVNLHGYIWDSSQNEEELNSTITLTAGAAGTSYTFRYTATGQITVYEFDIDVNCSAPDFIDLEDNCYWSE